MELCERGKAFQLNFLSIFGAVSMNSAYTINLQAPQVCATECYCGTSSWDSQLALAGSEASLCGRAVIKYMASLFAHLY